MARAMDLRTARDIIDETIHESRRYLEAIVIFIGAMAIFFVGIFILTWIYCILLYKIVGCTPTTIKRSSPIWALWYVFDRLWFITRKVLGGAFNGSTFNTYFYRGRWSSVVILYPFVSLFAFSYIDFIH